MQTLTSETLRATLISKSKAPNTDSLFTERLVRRFFGLVFGFAAIGLWMVPSANETADVILLKTGFTAILCFCCIIALLPRTNR